MIPAAAIAVNGGGGVRAAHNSAGTRSIAQAMNAST